MSFEWIDRFIHSFNKREVREKGRRGGRKEGRKERREGRDSIKGVQFFFIILSDSLLG